MTRLIVAALAGMTLGGVAGIATGFVAARRTRWWR